MIRASREKINPPPIRQTVKVPPAMVIFDICGLLTFTKPKPLDIIASYIFLTIIPNEP